ncbi:gamma-butyrobetaine hydroxylase-like domain-containing protein [Paraburkholderia sp.]|uniref:gamma-butyrobetaine hydroxylase-like domain-containing protein n=1 Tax=Paraburkholderia sp. TaxID=1926495 RepID=UPI003D6F7252
MIVLQRVSVDGRARTLTLEWDDAYAQTLAHALLRAQCPCAACRRARLAGDRTLHVPQDVAIVDVQPMGYGVQIAFSDGHAQGIYPWTFLRTLDAKNAPEKRPA